MARCPICREELELCIDVIACTNPLCDWDVEVTERGLGLLQDWGRRMLRSINESTRIILLRSPEPPEPVGGWEQ